MNEILEIYYLKNCSPDAAFQWLKDRKFNVEQEHCKPSQSGDCKENACATLLTRKDPLINLGIALYSKAPGSFRKLFDEAVTQKDETLITACLSNANIQSIVSYRLDGWHALPLILGIPTALESIITNDWAPDSAIEEIILKKGSFAELDEEAYLNLIEKLKDNLGFLGYFDYIHDQNLYPGPSPWDGARNAFYSLLEELDACDAVGYALAPVLEEFIIRNKYSSRGGQSEAEAGKLLNKWKYESDDHWVCPMMRTLIAIHWMKANQAMLRSKDKALRSAFYRSFNTQDFGDDWEDYLDSNDPEIFNLVYNQELWSDEVDRDKMLRLAERVRADDVYEATRQVNLISTLSDKYRREHPEYFKPNEPQPSSEQNGLKSDLETLMNEVSQISSTIDEIKQEIQETRKTFKKSTNRLSHELHELLSGVTEIKTATDFIKSKAINTKKSFFG
jgi:hypothetical protein